jgi:LysR family hydrogen peroxide-inducible transcriptional activator
MNLRDLDYIVAVAETGQVGLAAERCHVSQPTLSMQLKKLETELGLALFERGARGAVPTERGRAVIAQARVVLEAAARLKELAAEGAEPLTGILRLGVIPTVAPYLLPHALPAIHAQLPRLRLHLREAVTRRLLEQLLDAELDAVILSPPFEARGLASAPLGHEPILVALPAGHPLAARGAIAPAELAGLTVLLLEDGHCFKDQALRLCTRLRMRPLHEVEAASIESLRQMVSIGMGLGLLPALATQGPFAAGTAASVVVRPLAEPMAARELVLAWRRGFPRMALLERLVPLLAAVLGAERAAA